MRYLSEFLSSWRVPRGKAIESTRRSNAKKFRTGGERKSSAKALFTSNGLPRITKCRMTCDGGFGCRCRNAPQISPGVAPLNRIPHHDSSCSAASKENSSVCPSSSWARICSGDM
jgi:hypothetical protein